MMVLHEHIRQDKCLKSTFLETADLLTFKNFKFPNMAGNCPEICLKKYPLLVSRLKMLKRQNIH